MDSISKLRVLIVEDQKDFRLLLRSFLSDFGISKILEANDGRKGLSFIGFGKAEIDLILCDWNMPGMSGLDFMKKVRDLGVHTPFIMITGRGDEHSVLEDRQCGVHGYIRKPFSPDQLEARLRIVVQRSEEEKEQAVKEKEQAVK